MDKLKQQLIVAVIILLLGLGAGWGLSNWGHNGEEAKAKKQYEKSLEDERKSNAVERDSLQKIINDSVYLRKLDSVMISDLHRSIKEDGVRVEKQRKDAAKLTPNEKIDWLLRRYNSKP